MTKRHVSKIVGALLVVVCGIVQAGSLEWAGSEEGVCLQEGIQNNDLWSHRLKQTFNWVPYIRHGRLVRADGCDQSRRQDWDIDEGGRVSAEAVPLKVFRWRKRFYPATSVHQTRQLLPVKYSQQRLSFEYRGQKYCLSLRANGHFRTKAWDNCLETSDTRWLFDLPPDPGEDGLVGLAGVDSNHDGVRDDVERFIERALIDSEKGKVAAKQLANVSQKRLENAYDREKVIGLDNESAAAVLCLLHVMGQDASAFRHEMKAKIYNTVERIEAWNKMNSHLNGLPYTLPEDLGSQCSFTTNGSTE